MAFSATQVKALRRNLARRHVRSRERNGRELAYIEGWHAISEANRIFGFDGWSRETIECRCVLAREQRGTFLAVYIAKVRITVKADGLTIIREGHGTGEGRASTPGEVHDMALKAAETDGTKRALATFGRPFGLALYRHGKLARRSSTDGARPTETDQMTAFRVPDAKVILESPPVEKLISVKRHQKRPSRLKRHRPWQPASIKVPFLFQSRSVCATRRICGSWLPNPV
jgi:DNA recombination protein Rad52